jgi:hypothetical protein
MLIDESAADGMVFRAGTCCPRSSRGDPAADRAFVDASRPAQNADGAAGNVAAITIPYEKLTEILGAMERYGTIVRVSPDLYFLRASVDRVREDLTGWLSAKGATTAAEFRDHFKTSRKYAIPLLEYFDREGVTLRRGDLRQLRRPIHTGTETA